MIRSILVLEAPWDEHSVRSTSVWPFISEFARIASIDAFHQSFTDGPSFIHWLKCFHADDVKCDKLLYVAAHGTSGRIGSLKRKLNGSNIAAAMQSCPSIASAHFGSCFFGTESRLVDLVNKVKNLRYAAGYSQEIPWIESMALDLLVLNRLVNREDDEKHARRFSLLKELVATVPGLSSTLGFGFAYRYGSSRVFSSSSTESAA